MSRKTIVPVFSLALSVGGYWWYLRTFRQDLNEMFNSSGNSHGTFDTLTQPGTEETVLLIVSTVLLIYGLYKVVLFLKTGKQIDEEVAIDTFLKENDREFSVKTNIIIWSIILSVFTVIVWYVLSISQDISEIMLK